MNEKEKALDILQKINNGKISKALWVNCSDYAKKDLKRKAFIVIDEILQDYKSYRVKFWLTLEHALEMCEYWEKVRIEIDNFEPA